MVGTIGSFGHIRGWICLGSGHPFAKGHSRSRGTGKVQISTWQAAGRPVLPVRFPSGSQRILIHDNSKEVTKNYFFGQILIILRLIVFFYIL